MRTRNFYVLILVFVLLYLVFFPLQLVPELTVEARWAVVPAIDPVVAIDAQHPAAVRPDTDDQRSLHADAWIPFTGESFGWVDPDGRVRARWRTSSPVAIGPDLFVAYPRHPDQLVVRDVSGVPVASLPVFGYPFFVGGALFVSGPDALALTRIDHRGEPLWTRRDASPVTSVAVADEYTVIGTLGGRVTVVGSAGSVVADSVPADGSGAVTVSVATDRAAALVAVARQRLDAIDRTLVTDVELFARTDDRLVSASREVVARAAAGFPVVDVSSDGGVVAFARFPEQEGYLVDLIDVEAGTAASVAGSLPVRQVLADRHGTLVVLFGRSEDRDPAEGFRFASELAFADTDGMVPIRVPFHSDSFALSGRRQLVILHVDDRILAVRVEAR